LQQVLKKRGRYAEIKNHRVKSTPKMANRTEIKSSTNSWIEKAQQLNPLSKQETQRIESNRKRIKSNRIENEVKSPTNHL